VNALLAASGQVPPVDGGLTVAGAVIMTISILLVLGLTAFCMAKILRETHPEEHHHAPLDINTHDTDP
jgi:hypothetical protein